MKMGATTSAQAATGVTYNNILNTPPAECPAHQPGFKGGTVPPHASSATAKPPAQNSPDGWVSECPAAQADGTYKMPKSSGECPVKHGETIDFDYRNMMPPPNQRPAPDQPFPLGTGRKVSSIPKAGDESNWVYPSEQMFWNAMLRKGWRWKEEGLDPNDMQHIINIHNANNEQAWEEILKWEALHYREGIIPKLKSFRGKAQEPSPRARLRGFLGYEMPFDRHDWVIDREGRDVRYIIDYYDGGKVNQSNYQFTLLDVRPALDSPQAIWDRMKVTWWRWTSSNKDTPAEHPVDHTSQPTSEAK